MLRVRARGRLCEDSRYGIRLTLDGCESGEGCIHCVIGGMGGVGDRYWGYQL